MIEAEKVLTLYNGSLDWPSPQYYGRRAIAHIKDAIAEKSDLYFYEK